MLLSTIRDDAKKQITHTLDFITLNILGKCENVFIFFTFWVDTFGLHELKKV